MTLKTFFVLFVLYIVGIGGPMWWVFSSQYKPKTDGVPDVAKKDDAAEKKKKDDLPGWHYAVDTITLRGRIADPADDELENPIFFKFWEDLSSLAVFVLFGFGVAFSISTVDALWAVKQFRREPPEQRHRFRTFKEWMKEKHPETYHSLYPQEEGPAKSSGVYRAWLAVKRWLLNVKEEGRDDATT